MGDDSLLNVICGLLILVGIFLVNKQVIKVPKKVPDPQCFKAVGVRHFLSVRLNEFNNILYSQKIQDIFGRCNT
ncbi:hypothetical protein N783_00030 [Pontibacillus marinus BH030004 = DSM 16465]|uniref:Uncharacterized protein n=1 Tax=Pontibacillus marinus BH030004 = DSM 16465 TaxID=1385511 RepID=A0A0A5GF50_9BACI|nr:hypothetical protein N783_00030 [Pontibacillus marinus BH030004 = DSM 16465]